MEGFAKVLLVLTVLLGALPLDVKGGRALKELEGVDHPETFGNFGFPSPGFGGSFPRPGLGGSFPSPGFTGGSFPTPSFGSGSFCSFPGVHCGSAQTNLPGGSNNGAGVSGSP